MIALRIFLYDNVNLLFSIRITKVQQQSEFRNIKEKNSIMKRLKTKLKHHALSIWS
jgi:hypothetical protein